MASVCCAFGLFVALCPNAIAQTPVPARNPFGVQMGLSSNGQIATSQSYGVPYFRIASAVLSESFAGSCRDCDLARQLGFRLILTVRANGAGQTPTVPPTNLAAYQTQVASILDHIPVEILVIENEETSRIFYTGNAEEYADQLEAACTAAHDRGIACTNGGLVSAALGLLTWQDLLERGDAAGACDFARRIDSDIVPAGIGALLCSVSTISELPIAVQSALARGTQFVAAYRNSPIDYVNFHWYITDTKALAQAVSYLNAVTGKPAMCNEMGQHTVDPDTIAPLLTKALELGLPYLVWFSIDSPQAVALQDLDGALRPNGVAFAQFMRDHFPRPVRRRLAPAR